MSTIYIHPMIVHFPIALIMIGALVALISKFVKSKCFGEPLFHFAAISIIIGAAAAVVAIVSGYLFTKDMVGIMGEIRSTHILWAFSSVACGAVAAFLMGVSLWKKGAGRNIWGHLALLISLITAVLIGITGHYGGMMVFG